MAINFIKKEDLSHITRTTRQWETTIDRYEIIPKGVLCIELCNDKLTKIKIGNGHLIYEQLPYVSDVNLSDYYTKEETNTLLKNLKSIKIKGEASSLSDLPLRGNEEGDLWFVKKQDPDKHSRYDEYVWYNNKWESFGSSDIDLSEYAKKSYVDTHIQEVQDEITEIIESGYLHKHDNKDILDQTSAVYNVEKDNKLRDLHNYDDTELREKAHTHLNKNILDQTDAVYNRDKDDKLASLHNYDDTTVKQRLSSLESVSHSHSNQDILNRTTAAFTKEQALTLLDCKDFKGTDGVHDGYHGFVPAPTKDDIGKVLGANGQWVEGGSSGGDTITEGGGISITTDAQTGNKVISVNAGTGLDIDQQTGELYVTATGGDSIAEGNGIDITTDSQTGVKTISVDIGDGLQFNQNSEIELNTGDGLSIDQSGEIKVNTSDGLSINQDNELEVSLGNGLQFDSNNAIEVNVGDGLSINASDEVELDKATTTDIGGVIVGDNIDVNNGTISVPKAASNKLGVVKPSDGLSVDSNGVLTVDTGDGLSIDSTTKEVNVNAGDGLSVNASNELEVNVGDGLTVDANNNLKAKIGVGLHFNEENAIEADEIDIDTYEPGNGISFIRHYARELPTGYTQLEYIESRFDAGFILDYYPQKTSKIVCEAAYVDVNRSTPSDNCLFGSRNGNVSSSKQFVLWFNNKTSDPCYVGFVYTGDTWSSVGEHPTYANMYQRLLFEISPSIGVYCNNVLIQNPLSYPDRDPSPYKLGILCLATSDTGIDTTRNYQSGRIFTFKIYESDTLVVDLVPCLNDSDVPGLYDMVSEVFYPSASGTDFAYDPDAVVTHDSITIDANRGPGIIYDNNALSLNPGAGLSIDATDNQKLNVNLADGLSIKNTSTNAIKINTGDGLSIDSTTNKLNVNIGDGLIKDSSNNIGANLYENDLYIESVNNQIRINPLYAPTYEAGNGVQFVSTSPYNLPPNYTKLSCVESKNTSSDKSAFRLNYVPTTETKFDVLFGITKASFSDVTIIGSGGSNTAKYSLNITRSSAATNNTTVRFNYCQDGSSASISFTTVIGDILHIVADKNGVYVNNNLVQTPHQTGSPSAYKLCVGSSPATNSAGSFRDPSTPGKYYDIKIYEGNTLTVHLIPCLNDSNVPGMYDEVNEHFYHNEWKTDFHYDENEKTRPGYYVQAKLGNGLQFDANNAIEVVNGGTEYTAGDGIDINASDEISVKIGQALSINNSNEIDVNLGRALSINNNNEINVDIATATSLGVVKAGSGLNIDEFGNLSTQAAPFRIGRALSLDDESVRLPSAYMKAKYVENQGGANTVTPFYPSAYPNAKCVVKASVESAEDGYRHLFGTERQNSWSGAYSLCLEYYSYENTMYTRFNYATDANNNIYAAYPLAYGLGDIIDIECSRAGGLKINNEVIQTTSDSWNSLSSYQLAIFGLNVGNGVNSGVKGRIYSFKIYDGDTLIHNFVPAVRKSDNVVGFYNTSNNTFYSSIQSTEFTTDMDELDVDEPDWVLNADIATSNSLGVVKPSTGLVVNAQGALTLDKASASTIGGVKVGNNLSIDSNGVLSANIINYSAGHAIEIVGDLSIDKFRWEITANAGDSMVAFRYFEYSDSDHIAFTIQNGTIEWSDGSTVSYPSGYDETFAGMMENRTKCTVTGWGGDKTLIMTFTLSQSIMLSDIAYFRWKTDDYMSGRQPTEFNIYAHDSVNDEWILLKEVTDHSLVPSSGNTWSNYIEIEPEIEPGAINVKYGNGLTLNQNNELEVSIGDGLVIDEDGAVALENLPEFYLPGTAISFNPSAVLYPTEFSDVLFVQSITRIWNGSIVKADDNKSFTLTASGNDCYTCEYEPGRSGIYLFPAEASTKYRLTWTSSDDTVSGSIYAFENNGFDHIYSVDQSVLPYLEFTTSATATTLNFRFGVQNPPDSITFSNIRLYKIINDGDDEISVNYGDGLTVNQDNELEVNIGSGLQFDANGAIEVVNSGTEYTAGDGIDIDVNNEISVVTGDGIVIDENGAVALEEQPTEYRAGEAISIETVGGLQPTNYSNDDFVDSIASMNAGSIVKAADRSSFTLTASYNDCYTRGTSGQANGSYPFNVKASTKYRFAWDSADPTVHGKVYTYENGLYDAMMHEIDQYDSSYLEFTTSANTTFIQARFGVMYAGDSITYSNVRLYEVLEDEDQYDEISVKYGNGLTVNERNELEVSYGNGLALVSNSQYRPEYYFSTQVQCKVHTDNYYLSPRSFDRTFQKTTTEPALCCLWEYGSDGYRWVCPLIVGTTATSVQYTAIDLQQTVSDQNTFQYLGQTWYTSGYPISINDADHEDKLGNLQYLGAYTTTSDQIQAAKDLIDLALINAGSLQAKLGDGLTFDENDAITLDESIKLIIHCVGDPLT